MLESLYIKDFALIDEIEVNFSPGLNILSGETGAGKSIVVEALQMVLGERASVEVIRTGAEKSQVDAVFHIPNLPRPLKEILDEYGIEPDEGRLILSRHISADGRSKAWISGRPVPISVLQNLGNQLVDFHGQHEHQAVLKPLCQLELLDSYADTHPLCESVKEKFYTIKKIDEEIASIEDMRQRQNRELELLRHELNEIEQVSPTIGEDETLHAQLSYAMNMENIRKNAKEVSDLLSGSDISVIAFLHHIQPMVEELKRHDTTFEPFFNRLEEIQCELQELARECERCCNLVEISEEEIERLNQRLNQINRLKRKYGNTIEGILEYAQKAHATLETVLHGEQRLEELRHEREKLYEEIMHEAEQLSEKRKSKGTILASEVTKLLKELGMKEATFKIGIERCLLNPNGINKIEFLLSANVGEPEKPLKQIASGGEMSRVMLALKTTLANADQIPTLIFDEIDAGVGGIVARKVANQLTELAQHHQVVVITHIPQIAVFGTTHFLIQKEVIDGRTITSVQSLKGDERIKEIARMLDGSVSEISLKHANELLKEVKQQKGAKSNGRTKD
ncbi:MAG TPA: DNA repair protein RecN [Candidatus Hydrogenedens sp.]|nr:DNA repair protein RecN [Candidatus Hydrogenedens sp.]